MTQNANTDRFADIAATGIHFTGKGLVEPPPPERPKRTMELAGIDSAAIFKPVPGMDTAEQLKQELIGARARYSPYMKQYHPELADFTIRRPLETFQWRIGTPEDLRHFQGALAGDGEWRQVQLPHYGEPLGKAFTLYRTEFEVTDKMLGKGSIFVTFKGVDYKAHVYVNGNYVGSHEGFFAPFQFECTAAVSEGSNILVVKVENDNVCGDRNGGDKLYAATGVGYDDPLRGWHHCPPGMGIYQGVAVEARPKLHIADLFVRPLPDLENAEVWIEVNSLSQIPKELRLSLSVYGRNFEEVVLEDHIFQPATTIRTGLGDSFTESKLRAEGRWNAETPMPAEYGRNRYIVPIQIVNARRWEPDAPWLYQLHVRLEVDGKLTDTSSTHFGMRYFRQDTESSPKGAFYLNDRPIRLRGANTMGHEQQNVAKENWDQLRDDILLAKLCHMNFLRITQRPVEKEVYLFCDMLGLMVQTDLPLFGVLSRSQYCEAIRQTEEMERLIRPHPCCILVSYINEPFPNAQNRPHRHLTRPELQQFFAAADTAVRLNNPDRVIKHVDGDYDPPDDTMPDNHCYPCWYNGHGIDIGRLHKGWWMPVKPDWHYGCGEFGAEGLDPVSLMEERYPAEWLPASGEDERTWSPDRIIGAQSGKFHYFFYDTPDTLEGWVEASHRHQAWATRIMTEAFRRDARMNSFAIHLFIDAFPSGWMKTIMDVERRPKPAYFAYRDALRPLHVNIRTDRLTYTAGENMTLEAWVCNDLAEAPEDCEWRVMAVRDDRCLAAARETATVPVCSSACLGLIAFEAPEVEDRSAVAFHLSLCDSEGRQLAQSMLELEVYPRPGEWRKPLTAVLGQSDGPASRLALELELPVVTLDASSARGSDEAGQAGGLCGDLGRRPDIILAEDAVSVREAELAIRPLVEAGTRLIVLELEPGVHQLLDRTVEVRTSNMQPLHFVSRRTGHPLVRDFQSGDFRLWHDPALERISPILHNTFAADGMSPVLLSANTTPDGAMAPAMAAGECAIGDGFLIVSQISLAGRCRHNPAAYAFARRLLELSER